MSEKLTVSLIQSDLHWEKPETNKSRFESIINKLPSTDIIILPELFTTGFTMNVSETFELMDGPSVIWMRDMASRTSAAICGSIVIKEGKDYFNRLFFISPEGLLGSYDKRHLFRMGDEHRNYTTGKKRIVINYKGWRILPQICYDLRFPVWSRNRGDYDLMINVANWPASRQHVWTTLLAARAIENQCYVVGLNRVGIDGTGLDHCGNTMLVDYKGRTIKSIPYGEEGHFTETIDLKEQNNFKERFPAYLDADEFKIPLNHPESP
jgi:predicted amidohydrolase